MRIDDDFQDLHVEGPLPGGGPGGGVRTVEEVGCQVIGREGVGEAGCGGFVILRGDGADAEVGDLLGCGGGGGGRGGGEGGVTGGGLGGFGDGG